MLEMEDMDDYDGNDETDDVISKVQMLPMKIEKEEKIDVSAPLLQPILPSRSCPEALMTHSAAINIKTEATAKGGTITTRTRSQPAINTYDHDRDVSVKTVAKSGVAGAMGVLPVELAGETPPDYEYRRADQVMHKKGRQRHRIRRRLNNLKELMKNLMQK